MGANQSADEQKTSALAQENERLKDEVKKLKQKLGNEEANVYSSDNVDSGGDSGADSGFDSGKDEKGTVEEEYTVSDEDNMSVGDLISRGLRLQPLFDEKGQCVELVATVVDDIVTQGQSEEQQTEKKKKKKGKKTKETRSKENKKKTTKENQEA